MDHAVWAPSAQYVIIEPAAARDQPIGAVIGDLAQSFRNLFPDITLNTLGIPLVDPDFIFTKGTATGFYYKNLSGGEKSIFST